MDPTTEADLVAALEHMEEDETQLVEYQTRPALRSTAAQTEGVVGAGRMVRPAGRPPPGVDAGTLLKRLRVMLPMVKAADNDQAFNDLILKHLIS